MKISYSILTHNETTSLMKLIDFLLEHKDEEDEIVILDDYSDNEKTLAYLDAACSIHEITLFDRRYRFPKAVVLPAQGKHLFLLHASIDQGRR